MGSKFTRAATGNFFRGIGFRRFAVYFGILLLLSATRFSMGQTTSGDLAGTVKDVSSAVIVQASVTVVNEDTHVSTTIQTGSSGEYHASNLLAGKYDVTVNAAGFQTFTLKGIVVDLNKTSTSNISLSVVGASATVEVSAEAGAVLDTTTANLATTFSTTEVAELPSASIGGAGQSGVLNLSLLSPGVASSGGLGIGIGPSIGGQRPRNNNFELEGIDNNNKAITGPLVYVPNDAVGSFTLITNQFSPEFGHSSGGQFNSTLVSGTDTFHGRLYEYFQNRNLNAASGIAGSKIPNPPYDNNRYGGQIGGPILKGKLFFFANFERNKIAQNASGFVCVPSPAGIATLNSLASSFNATNLQQYLKYTPAATVSGQGGIGIDAVKDAACFGASKPDGEQILSVTDSAGVSHDVDLGNYLINAPAPTLFEALTTGGDYTISAKDSLRLRYIHDWETEVDTSTGISLPTFYVSEPFKWHLFALSEFHNFTPNLTNEFRLGFNRYSNTLGDGNFTYPGLDQFPTFQFYDQGFITVGPDGNAPQFTIQNLYQLTDNIIYTKGKHTFAVGFDGRKYISPQGFTQRARGDYEYAALDQFLHDMAPDENGFAERSTGGQTYYGDQTALYGYANDTWSVAPTLTLNAGVRYEFTSVPTGEREQALNSVASYPGLINFHAPQPAYTSFAPRVGINWAPDDKTSVRAGFGLAYDVLFDNLGTLSFPPQLSQTSDVGGNGPAFSSPNFLKNGGLPPGGTGAVVLSASDARADTAAYLPNQIVPYAETYTLTVQRTIGTNYTAEIGYVGTRGIHLPTQDQINIQPRVTAANQLPTYVNGATLVGGGSNASTLDAISSLSNIVPAYKTAGFTSKITSYQPYSSSNYNGLVANLTRRFQNGLQMNASYTWSKTMDDATDEVFATVLTPRRPQNSQCVACDYSRSALDRTHRLTLELLYDVQAYKHSDNFLLKNLVGNWLIAPIYTYESPEYSTALSGVNSNLNGDSGAAIDRPLINRNGVKGTGTTSIPIANPALVSQCIGADDSSPAANGNANGLYVACSLDTVGYSAGSATGQTFNAAGTQYVDGTFTASNAYYVQAGPGTLPTAGRNTLAGRPIDNIDLAFYKRITLQERYSLEFGVQAFNVLNHAQYQPGTLDNVNGPSYTTSYNYQTVTSAAFDQPEKEFLNNARTMQLTGKINF
jgi:Carboxypeptidase regulatory-like domain/TonB dependent receptor